MKLANPGKITIKEKHWILNLTIIKEKIQLLFKLNANRKLVFICSEPKKTYEVLKEQ
ncbi:hypothetical protein [Mesomycoplasma ovipneumoniae]|uniref:hypothetical protein n=1 Tax=Mesomycoplasma ovipneumoniae TaxID=29562 RepID=UPI00311ACF34